MNSLGKTSTAVAKVALLRTVVCFVSIFLINGMLGAGIAKSQLRREMDNQVPKHLPVKIRIKKEKEEAVGDEKNEKWMHDFVLEVTNTGDKPIYYLYFVIIMPEIKGPDGSDMAFPINYGRVELGSMVAKAGPEDIPINPGETLDLKAYDSSMRGWDNFRKHRGTPDAKKLILTFQLLTFGDGTGFMTTEGIPFPEK